MHGRPRSERNWPTLEEIALATKPSSGDLPNLRGVDVSGVSIPLRQAIGGDHVIYLDFKQRYDLDRRIREAEAAGNARVVAGLRQSQRRAGVLVADVSGHKATDALVAAMLHQAFLLGAYYELDLFGEITTRLFEHINQRFYKFDHVEQVPDHALRRGLGAGQVPLLLGRPPCAHALRRSPGPHRAPPRGPTGPVSAGGDVRVERPTWTNWSTPVPSATSARTR